eukprot:SAG11_NODE_7699_length_1108_cov_1.543112_1_plen_151_part_00
MEQPRAQVSEHHASRCGCSPCRYGRVDANGGGSDRGCGGGGEAQRNNRSESSCAEIRTLATAARTGGADSDGGSSGSCAAAAQTFAETAGKGAFDAASLASVTCCRLEAPKTFVGIAGNGAFDAASLACCRLASCRSHTTACTGGSDGGR